MDAGMPIMELRGVTKQFGDKTVLDGINLKIYENQVTTIIGKSGTGKSVLLKHIIGLLKPDEGTVLYRGKPLSAMKRDDREEFRSHISYLFQNNALLDSMTVFENVALPLRQTTNLAKKEIETRVKKKLEDLELADASYKYPSELSGGMQKRVALARALVTDPAIVLFDEPTTGQDPIRKNMILSMIVHYKKRFGYTTVMISHDIPDVFFISDRIVILWEGRVGFEGTYEEAVRLKHPMIDEFLRSLEGFEDELTGLLSREAFRVHYGAMLGGVAVQSTISAALFSVEFDLLSDALGPLAALEVLRALADYTNKHFGSVGAFSARHSRDKILTIFPHTSADEAKQLVAEFAKQLEQDGLPKIQSSAQKTVGAEACFEVYVLAGVTDIGPSDEINTIIEKAQANQTIVATHRCDAGGSEG